MPSAHPNRISPMSETRSAFPLIFLAFVVVLNIAFAAYVFS
jgi:hypothetical protein